MKSVSVEMLVQKNEDLSDLLEDLKSRIQDIRKEIAYELDDLEDMIAETIEIRMQ